MISVQIPAVYYASLLAQSKRKAQALLTYCTTIATGYKPSSRNFADLIGLSKSQAALWIIDFDQAMFEENRTVAGHSKNPISGTFEAQNNYISNDKSDSNRTVSSQTVDTQDSSNSGESDVSSLSPDTSSCTRAGSCKRDPLKGISSRSENFSFWKKSSKGKKSCGEQIQKQRKFQEFVRSGYLAIKDKLIIELKNGGTAKIRHIGAKALLEINGKIANKEESLKVWQELYGYAGSVIGGLEVAKTVGQDHFVLLRNNELFRRPYPLRRAVA